MIQRKKMTSRITSLWGLSLLCLCMVFCLLADMPVEAAQASKDGKYAYEVLADKTIEITRYNGKETNVVIPRKIDGKKVTSIGASAFANRTNVKSIEIPSSVTSIKDSAFFGCSSLKSIEIPSSVTSIGDYCTFIGCSSLTSIEIPYGVTSIGQGAFSGCSSLKSIEIPSSVTSIERAAFYVCTSLTSIEIPSGMTSIGEAAFYGCSNLKSIEIPSSVTNIGNDAFSVRHSGFIICGETGSRAEQYAERCGITFCEREIPPAHTHTYKTTTTKATAKKNGSMKEKCSICGYKKPTITIYKVSDIKLSKTSLVYNKKNQKPTVTVKDSEGKKLSTDSYTVSYPKNCKNVGEYTVTVTLQGKYSGTVKLTYQITPKSTSISKLTAKKKGFTAKWKKQTSQTTGYELQYSTSSKFKGAKTVTIKKNKTTSKNIAKLKAGKKYYVRIRTYKTVKVSGKSVKIYSGWSKTKNVKTKK